MTSVNLPIQIKHVLSDYFLQTIVFALLNAKRHKNTCRWNECDTGRAVEKSIFSFIAVPGFTSDIQLSCIKKEQYADKNSLQSTRIYV